MSSEPDDVRSLIDGVLTDQASSTVAAQADMAKIASIAAAAYRRLIGEGIPEDAAREILYGICLSPYQRPPA